jgi:Rne/Rng family ribonuclease
MTMDDARTSAQDHDVPAPDPAGGGEGGGSSAAPSTSAPRTRTRSRRRGGDATATPPAADAAETPTTGAEAPARGERSRADVGAGEGGDTGDAGEGGAPRRRRRRGGRGRGRGRAVGEGGVATDEGSADGEDAARADSDDAAGEGGRRPAKRAARSSTKKATSRDEKDGAKKDGPAKKDGAKKAAKKATKKRAKRSGSRDSDAETEAAIARGGTRMAAKRGRGGGGGGGGGGRGRRERPHGVTEEQRRAILAGPPRTMLVTARPERTQIAVMEDRTLVEHYVTRDEDTTFVGNIYMGRVQNVLPGMEAAFVDIGKGRNGVLYAGEVLYDEHDLEEESDQRIEKALRSGQKVLVQVTKDPMGTKGPRLTMHLSLAGRYVVLAPHSKLFGISRKLTDEERERLRRIVKAVRPEGHGVIVRTAAEGATEEQITADVARLVERWERVEAAAARAKPLEAVYEEPKLVVKVIRDIFGTDFVRCIVDEETLFTQVREYLDEIAPELADRVELYGAPTEDERARAAGAPSPEEAESAGGDAPAPAARRRDLPPLFDAFDVQGQLKKGLQRKVWLPSGGYLIIESTEAMKVIDVNTGRYTGGSDESLEEVVLKTNLEAADEIVRQLRLRDMGGMIIIDFIDMLLKSNQDQVVRRLKRELLRDRTKTRVSEVSRLGLVQMTRKNVSQGLVESFSTRCEHCEGHGYVTNLT